VATLALFYFNELNSVMDKQLNPWRITNQKMIYENPWIKLTEFQVINPSGGAGIYGKVHFKHRAVGVIPMDENGNIWLVGQYRFTLDQYSWEIPEGGGKMEEEPLEAAKRELLEETGLVAREWTKIMTMHLSNSVSDEEAIIFLARGLDQKQPQPEETEQLQVRKISFEEAERMVEEEKITDSMSVAAIQKIRLLVYEGKLKIRH
jgi:8-oxo-dGTP pyrophosphatase MutT (NUDIX family)